MRKRKLTTVLSVIFFCAAIPVFFINREKKDSPMSFVLINGKKIAVEIADSDEKRIKGLSGRSGLCGECGMLFIFSEKSPKTFWMKDMLFDLDIVFIADGEIKGISQNISHKRGRDETVFFSESADMVLEINAGKSRKMNLKVGDRLIF